MVDQVPYPSGNERERLAEQAYEEVTGGKRKGRKREDDEGEFSGYVLPRPELNDVALYGVLREMVDAACANSEAVPSTVAIHILARFAVTMGRTAYINIGDEQRHLRMNALIVGPTSEGRKGTSAEMPRRLFQLIESKLGLATISVKVLSALATGEGLIHQVRDACHDHEGKLIDAGVSDKRLLCNVSEFAGVLAQARREAATISVVLRDAFDGVSLTIPTKTSFNQVTDTHIVVIGSVPETGMAWPDPWKYDGGVRREPVRDLDLHRVIRRVGWHHCLKCRKPFWPEDVVRQRLCDPCKADEDRFT